MEGSVRNSSTSIPIPNLLWSSVVHDCVALHPTESHVLAISSLNATSMHTYLGKSNN